MISDIYDETPTPIISRVGSKTVTKKTEIREFTPPPQKRKIWAGPIIDRENLVDRLNELEKLNYEIFTILTISVAKVQVMCFLEIDDEKE